MLYVALIIVLLPYSSQTPQTAFKSVWIKTLTEFEGSDLLIQCIPTIPGITNLSLQKADGSRLPLDLNYTSDLKSGILIRSVRLSYSGKYVCMANVRSEQHRSDVYIINVRKRVQNPPSVYVEMDEYVAVTGETLQINCYIENPDHTYSATWRHSHNITLDVQQKSNNCTTLVCSIRVLTLTNLNESHSGNLTCSGTNMAGENTTSVSLRVRARPYLWLSPMLQADGPDVVMNVMEGALLSLRVGVDAHPTVEDIWWDTPRPQKTSTYQQAFTNIHRSYRCEASLLLMRIKADESGWYVFNARSSRLNASTQFKVHVYQKPSVEIKWKNGSLTCIASGYPTPNITWHQCEKLTTSDGCNNNLTSIVTLSSGRYAVVQPEPNPFLPRRVESAFPGKPHPNSTVQCEAMNIAGERRSSYVIEPPYVEVSVAEHKHWISQIFITIVSSASVVAALLLILLGVCIYKCKQKPKYEIRWKIVEINHGNNYTYVDPTQLPYNAKWEFPRDRLTFGQVLGAGAFGKVVEATAYGLEKDDDVTRVAVKMLKPSAHLEEKEALMCELKILSHLGPHANIVNLLGACTRGGPVLLITEYCSQGDLLNFLRKRASLFMNSTFHTHQTSSIYKNVSDQHDHELDNATNSYVDMLTGPRMNGHTKKDPSELNVDDLLRFSSQVAQGMDFLSSKNCIHRDVAARNVLVTDSLVAKICDFGLARDIMNDSNYVVRGNARLPVKWMSPESIFHCLYTVQSDVWSYGVLLWEIFSLGRSPYPELKVDARFYEMIKNGYQMEQPDFCPPEIYRVMKMCWSLEPTSRPTFDKIVQIINKLRPENSEEQQYKNVQQELEQKFSQDFLSTKAMEDLEERRPLTHANNYQIY